MLVGPVYGGELEIGMGSITQHFFCDECDYKYSGKINNAGLIFNQMQSVGYKEKDSKYTLFFGNNSVALTMFGLKVTKYVYMGTGVEWGFMWGGYFQDSEAFERKAGFDGSMGLGDFMPILGAEVNFTLYKTKSNHIMLNNNITPFLSTHALTFGFGF
jgi:hypothetical protein